MIDVNGTRHHLLLGAEDWRPRLAAGGDGLVYEDAGEHVGLEPRERRLPRTGEEEPLAAEQRRGAGVDRWGNVYWIGEDAASLHLLPAGTERAGEMWRAAELRTPPAAPETPAGDFQTCPGEPLAEAPTLHGLAVTRCHFLVVGTASPAGLLVFDLHAGGPPLWLRWPEAVPFAPFDLSPTSDGGVFVLDRESSRLWRLDRWFGSVPLGDPAELEAARTLDFEPLDGPEHDGELPARPPRHFPTGLELELSAPLGAWSAVALETLPDDSVLVLETDPAGGASRLHRFVGAEKRGELSLDGVLAPVLGEDAAPAEADVSGHDLVFVGAAASGGEAAAGLRARGELYLGSRSSAQAFLFGLEVSNRPGDELRLVPRALLLPVGGWDGKALVKSPGAGAEVGEGGEVSREVLYDAGDRWLPVAAWPGRRYAPRGEVEGLVFDSRQPDTPWHRIMLDACLPSGTELRVESRSADERHLLGEAIFRPEPAPVLRASGSELPFVRPFGDHASARSGTFELLPQAARGRFLELRLVFTGDGRQTPRLRALRVYSPRFSYLEQYLPAVYREDAASASLLDRFLSNLEGLLTSLEGHVAGAEVLFDSRTAPAEALPWLAGWLGAVLDPEWDEERRRLFLAHAAELFRWRGTPAGLLTAVRLAIDPCPDEAIFDALPHRRAASPVSEDPCSELDRDAAGGADGVRLVESFLARSLPRTVLGDPTVLEGPAVVASGEPWRPSHGAAALDRRYRIFLEERGLEVAANRRFETLPPAGDALEPWRAFLGTLAFPYAEVTATGAGSWRRFLAARYRTVEALGLAHRRADGQAWSSFDAVPLPEVLPAVTAALRDWIDFVSLALPLERGAHRFTVLVPARPGESEQVRERRRRLAETAIRQQKPAHTDFDVQLFWALFQVGGARLGLDTVLGEGSRFTALTLGSGYLGSSFLGDPSALADGACCQPPRPRLDSDPSACQPRL